MPSPRAFAGVTVSRLMPGESCLPRMYQSRAAVELAASTSSPRLITAAATTCSNVGGAPAMATTERRMSDHRPLSRRSLAPCGVMPSSSRSFVGSRPRWPAARTPSVASSREVVRLAMTAQHEPRVPQSCRADSIRPGVPTFARPARAKVGTLQVEGLVGEQAGGALEGPEGALAGGLAVVRPGRIGAVLADAAAEVTVGEEPVVA